MCRHVFTQVLLETTGADDDYSLGGAFGRQIRRYSRAFEHHFGARGREFALLVNVTQTRYLVSVQI